MLDWTLAWVMACLLLFLVLWLSRNTLLVQEALRLLSMYELPLHFIQSFTLGWFTGKRNNAIELWLNQVKRHPEKEAIVFTPTGESFTFKAFNDQVNQLAHFFVAQGIRPRDTVAIMLPNSPDFIRVWFALMKVGATSAFINYNLRDKALQHVLNVSKATVLVMQGEQVESVQGLMLEEWRMFSFDTHPALTKMDYSSFCTSEPDASLKNAVGMNDAAMLIYTSGTTGLPKAAIIAHTRLFAGVFFFAGMMQAKTEDRMYSPLPLYHASASILGMAPLLARGSTLIVSPKFSASRFFVECGKHNASIILYIGELCRFLLSTPPLPTDQQHQVRLAFGNGLRPDIWLAFKKRFGIKSIGEFYGSTEGNIYLVNYQQDDRYGVGAIGHTSFLLRQIMPLMVIKIDPVTEEPLRDAHGWCIPCQPGEVGELVAFVWDAYLPIKTFHGYHGNAKGTQKKVLEHVKYPGDKWFRSGDLIKQTSDYYYYFMDRVGDTFRWKGENVSTNEVAEHLSNFPGLKEINVYGVTVPNADGRAGMAGLVVDQTFDLQAFSQFAREKLPPYAVPVFLRYLPDLPTTGTMKKVKFGLQQEGIDPSKIQDPLYWMAPGSKTYVPFTLEAFKSL